MQVSEHSELKQIIVRADGSVEVCRCVSITDTDSGKELACNNEYTTFAAGTRMPDDVYALLTKASSH